MPSSGPATSRTSVSYGGIERFYDTDRGTTCLVKKRFVVVTEGDVANYTKRGSWDYVPADRSEADATVRCV